MKRQVTKYFDMIGIGTYIKLAGVLAIVAMIAAAVWYYKWSQNEIAVLNQNNATLTKSLEDSERAIKALQNSIKESREKLTQTQNQFSSLRKERNRISKKLGEHDIGYLASQKPGLVERIFSKGTDNAGRCYELATGAKHTEAELKATKRSQINKSCPGLANPNFKGEL